VMDENSPALGPFCCTKRGQPLTASRDLATGSVHFYGHEHIGAEMSQAILDRLQIPSAKTSD